MSSVTCAQHRHAIIPPASTGHRALDTGALWEGLHRGQESRREVIRGIVQAGCPGLKLHCVGSYLRDKIGWC